MSNLALIQKLYTSFAALDAEGMAACYHKEIEFHDPAFGQLKGERAANMWRMLCESQQEKGMEFKVIFSNVTDSSAHWEAFYTFSKTGRKVHNKIDASFTFKDGLILTHTDVFNLRHWAKQALGIKGALIGGTSFFQKKLQAQTNRLLDKFEAKSKQ